MQIFINELTGSVLQIFIFSLIPLVWWHAAGRMQSGFFAWIGLKWEKGKLHRNMILWIAGAIVGFWLIGEFSLYALRDVATATTEFSGLGWKAVPAVAIYAVFHTALSEEILFRGFLLKRISAGFGFQAGNMIQALLFGLLHGVLIVSEAGYLRAALLIGFTAAIAWTMGYINEKKADGSILPSWIIHGVTNLISGLCSAFLLGI